MCLTEKRKRRKGERGESILAMITRGITRVLRAGLCVRTTHPEREGGVGPRALLRAFVLFSHVSSEPWVRGKVDEIANEFNR